MYLNIRYYVGSLRRITNFHFEVDISFSVDYFNQPLLLNVQKTRH